MFNLNDVAIIAAGVALGCWLFLALDSAAETARELSRPFRRRFGLWLLARPGFDWLLARCERDYPLRPEAKPGTVAKRRASGTWLEADVYYFLDDPDPRRSQRWEAVIRDDGGAVSFWRKRQLMLVARPWVTVGMPVPNFDERLAACRTRVAECRGRFDFAMKRQEALLTAATPRQ